MTAENKYQCWQQPNESLLETNTNVDKIQIHDW